MGNGVSDRQSVAGAPKKTLTVKHGYKRRSVPRTVRSLVSGVHGFGLGFEPRYVVGELGRNEVEVGTGEAGAGIHGSV